MQKGFIREKQTYSCRFKMEDAERHQPELGGHQLNSHSIPIRNGSPSFFHPKRQKIRQRAIRHDRFVDSAGREIPHGSFRTKSCPRKAADPPREMDCLTAAFIHTGSSITGYFDHLAISTERFHTTY